MEPIVSRDEIRLLAWQAAEEGRQIHEANPYPDGTAAHAQFERDFWARDRELQGETVA